MMKIMFKSWNDEEYKQVSIKELKELKAQADKDSSGGSWGFEVITIEKIDDENNIIYLKLNEFEC